MPELISLIIGVVAALLAGAGSWWSQKQKMARIARGDFDQLDGPIDGKVTETRRQDGYRIDIGFTKQETDKGGNSSTNSASIVRNAFAEVRKPGDVERLNLHGVSDAALKRAAKSLLLHHVNVHSSCVRLDFMGSLPGGHVELIQDGIELAEICGREPSAVWARWEERGANTGSIEGQAAARLLMTFGAERRATTNVALAQLAGKNATNRLLAAMLLEDARALLGMLHSAHAPDRLRFRAADKAVKLVGRKRVAEHARGVLEAGFDGATVEAIVEVIQHLDLHEVLEAVARHAVPNGRGAAGKALAFLRQHGDRETIIALSEILPGPDKRVRYGPGFPEWKRDIERTIDVIRERIGGQPAGGLAIAEEKEGQVSLAEESG